MNKHNSRLDLTPERKARFTAEEFLRMNEAGAFDDMKIELVDGELERMNSAQSAHGKWQMRVGVRLSSAVGEEYVWGAVGIDLGNDTVMECDVALLATPVLQNRWLIPSEILLAIEIAQTTITRDMGMKRSYYAAAGIPTYWVVDCDRSVIHVYAEPIDGEYATVNTVKFGAPLAVPSAGGSIVID